MAQAQADQLAEVTVSAQRMVNTTVVSHSATGIPTELISISFRVNYADLDLTKGDGVQTLKSRIEVAAREGCEQLDRLYPLTPREAPKCIKKALDDSSAQLRNAIAAADEKAKALR